MYRFNLGKRWTERGNKRRKCYRTVKNKGKAQRGHSRSVAS